MSLKIQNTYSSPIMQTKTCFRSEKDLLAPINLPNCEETERIFNIKQQAFKEQNFCQKETERNYLPQKRNDTVYLTNNGSEIRQYRQNWTIPQQTPQKVQKMHEISFILEQNNLSSAYYAFQELRLIIAQYFQQPANPKVYSKLALLEAIQILKCEMQKKVIDDDDRSFIKQSKSQVKQLLQQITSLRSQNALLRQKLQLLKQDGGMSDCNSILNNSISFHSYRSCTSQSANNVSDQSFDFRIEKQIVKPFITEKESAEQSTLGLFTDSRDDHQRALISSTSINCLNSFVIMSPNHQEVQTEESLDQMLVINEEAIFFFIQNLKKLTRYFINAANLAFISKHDKMQKIKDFVQKITNFTSSQQKYQTLLEESMQFVNFIISNSSQVDVLITKDYYKLPFQIK